LPHDTVKAYLSSGFCIWRRLAEHGL